MKRNLQFGISFLLGVLLLYLVFWRFDMAETGRFLHNANPRLLTAGVALMVVAYLVRGMRWRIWQRGLSYGNAVRLILIGFMGNNILPARLGEVLRAHCAAPRTSEQTGRTAALGSIAAERILDGFMIAAFGLAGLALVAVDRRLQWALGAVSIGFSVISLAFFVAIHVHEKILSPITALNRRFPGRLTEFLLARIAQFLSGFRSSETQGACSPPPPPRL